MRSRIRDAPTWARIQFYRHIHPSYPLWAIVLHSSLNSSARSSSYGTMPNQYQCNTDTFMKILDWSFLSTNQSSCQMFPMGKIVCLPCLLVWMISCSHMPTLMGISLLFLSGDTQQPLGALGADDRPRPLRRDFGSTDFSYHFLSTLPRTHPLLPLMVESKPCPLQSITPSPHPKSDFVTVARGPGTTVTWS